jgi:hypothetical protein
MRRQKLVDRVVVKVSCVQLSSVNVSNLTQLKKKKNKAAFSMCISVSLARGFPSEKKTRFFHKLLFSFFVFLVVIVVVVVEAFFFHSLLGFFFSFLFVYKTESTYIAMFLLHSPLQCNNVPLKCKQSNGLGQLSSYTLYLPLLPTTLLRCRRIFAGLV